MNTHTQYCPEILVHTDEYCGQVRVLSVAFIQTKDMRLCGSL